MSKPERLVFMSPVDPPQGWANAFRAAAPDVDFEVAHAALADPAGVAWAIVWKPPHGALAAMPDLRCVFSLGAGVDHILDDPDYPRHVPISRVVDPYLTSGMSEYVVMHVLAQHRDLLRTLAARQQKKWDWFVAPRADETRVGFLGLGELGLDAARKLKPFDFRLLSWTMSRKDEPGIDSYAGLDEFSSFLAQTDILVCLLPLTEATSGILNTATFELMPPGARIINVGRGGHLIEADLVHALDSGHLGGATLDVFQHEPLPQDSPLWTHPRVMLTPHIASAADPRSTATSMAESIARIRAGGRPLNEVDLGKGY